MNANRFIIAFLAITIFLILSLATTFFTVEEGHHAIVLRLGRLLLDKNTDQLIVLPPGWHVKTPFIEQIRVFDTRIQTLDIKSSRIVTKEKKDVIVDYYVKWQIADLARYFKSTGGNALKAETLLEQQLNTSLRAEFGKRTIPELVSQAREDVIYMLHSKATQQANGLGIKIVDVRIKGIELPENTSNAIYQRMRANMQKIASRHRADGQATAEAIRANADAKATVLLAKAKSSGQKIKAAGIATAADIYAQAFNKNQEFFTFYQSLKAYENSFNNKKDLLILNQDSDFFTYFKHPLFTKSLDKPRI